jgi:hypothetical protein
MILPPPHHFFKIVACRPEDFHMLIQGGLQTMSLITLLLSSTAFLLYTLVFTPLPQDIADSPKYMKRFAIIFTNILIMVLIPLENNKGNVV